MDVAGRFFAGLLAVIVIFLVPLQYIAQAQSEIVDEAVGVYAAEFADTARHEGKITLDAYEDLIHQIDQTGELYDVEIEVSHPVSGKEIVKKTFGDEMPDLITENTSLKNKETNLDRKVLSQGADKEIFSLATTHVHTPECYIGHKHISSCYTPHTHKNLNYYPRGTTYAPSNDYYYYGAYNYDPLYYLYQSGSAKNFCYVPKYYRFEISTGNTYFILTYSLQIDTYGTERYVFYEAVFNGTQYYSFPQTQTLGELYQL
ncbi:MAG: hypothetical protein ACYDEX_20510, partial [Mobilitalea sp.]